MRTIDIREPQPELEPIGRIVFDDNFDETRFIEYNYLNQIFTLRDDISGCESEYTREEFVNLANAIDRALDLQGEFGDKV